MSVDIVMKRPVRVCDIHTNPVRAWTAPAGRHAAPVPRFIPLSCPQTKFPLGLLIIINFIHRKVEKEKYKYAQHT